jgi:serine/threonine-protein kinase/endoribonuclease IRE1
MHFLIAASDYVEFEKPTAPVVLALDLRIGDIVRTPPEPGRPVWAAPEPMTDWLPALDALLVANLVRYRAYKTTSLRDLLRVIRNKYNHFRDLPLELQQVLGPVPEGFYAYFRVRFPRLLLCVFEVVKEYFGEEDVFSTYFYKRPVKEKIIT